MATPTDRMSGGGVKARVGAMRDRVELQSATRTPDTFGDTAGGGTAWATLATVWAEVVPVSGDEARPAGAPVAITAYRVRVRYTSAILAVPSTELRAVWRGKTLNATGVVDEEGRRRFLIITCTEGR